MIGIGAQSEPDSYHSKSKQQKSLPQPWEALSRPQSCENESCWFSNYLCHRKNAFEKTRSRKIQSSCGRCANRISTVLGSKTIVSSYMFVHLFHRIFSFSLLILDPKTVEKLRETATTRWFCRKSFPYCCNNHFGQQIVPKLVFGKSLEELAPFVSEDTLKNDLNFSC